MTQANYFAGTIYRRNLDRKVFSLVELAGEISVHQEERLSCVRATELVNLMHAVRRRIDIGEVESCCDALVGRRNEYKVLSARRFGCCRTLLV